ncbi:MAG TPA: septum formation initiator family protein [Acidimicrobiales bacterium]|nr:septum formation initiator family protein [Acidimicrobiales bacterium]
MRARLALALVGSTAVIAFLAVAVFPTSLWLGQRRDIASTEHRVRVLERANKVLHARVQELDSDAAVERIAREQHNLVKPGEDAYAVLPAAGDAKKKLPKPTLAPAISDSERNFWERLRDRVSFWV